MPLIEIFWPAIVLTLLLVFIHAIFGIEIIRRGVIFTDLAIGQIAAIGTAISIAFMQGTYQTPMTLLFAMAAAVIITLATKKAEYVEAFIGLLYALGISAIMLILAQSSEGTELFKKLSAADILFASPAQVMQSALLYSIIAAVMLIVYPRLKGPAQELLFFALLAVTVTSSVQSAGVLVVFALLIAPAYAAIIQQRLSPLLFAWIFGSVAMIIALAGSYYFDLPTGYTMIFTVVLATLLFVFFSAFLPKSRER